MIVVGGFEEISSSETLFLAKNRNVEEATPRDLVYFIFDKKELSLYKSLIQRGMNLALHVSDLRELVYACNLNTRYVIAHKEDAASMQKAMDSYLYDTKLLMLIYEEEEIEWAVTNEIDGVLFALEEME